MRGTVDSLKKKKEQGKKLSFLSVYEAMTAGIADALGYDGLLVGDSLAMVFWGRKDTVSVTSAEMAPFVQAVVQVAKRSFVLSDIPYSVAHLSMADYQRALIDFVQQTGVRAIKLEGTTAQTLEKVEASVASGIAVMGHVGYCPQYTHLEGTIRREKELSRLRTALKDLESAGAWGVVLECVEASVAQALSLETKLVTIGIASGAQTDGQIRVAYDVLGYPENIPPFVEKECDMRSAVTNALTAHLNGVQGS